MAFVSQTKTQDFYQTGGEPEFFVTDIRTEAIGGGNLRIYAYTRHHMTQLHLLYTVVCSSLVVPVMAQQILSAAADAHNLQQWEDIPRH